MNGRNSIVVSRPNSNGVTSRTVAAISGRASCVIARAEDRDGLGGPQLQEVGVAEQAPSRLGHRRRVYGRRSGPAAQPLRRAGRLAASVGSARAGGKRPQRLRGPAARGRRAPRRGADRRARRASCSTGRPTRATTARCSRSRASTRRSPRASRRWSGRRSTRSTWRRTPASTRGSARSTSSRSCPLGDTTMDDCVELARGVRPRIAGALGPARLPVRPGGDPRRPGQARRRAARPVRGPQGRDRAQRPPARLRARADAPASRRGGGRAPGRSSSPGTSTSTRTTSSSPSGSRAASASRAAGCRGSRRTGSGSRSRNAAMPSAPRSR